MRGLFAVLGLAAVMLASTGCCLHYTCDCCGDLCPTCGYGQVIQPHVVGTAPAAVPEKLPAPMPNAAPKSEAPAEPAKNQ
ncbi:MAG: hypothetical protein NZM31_10640 [Gemmatales bacterium]|nr:hypothetical protein [Gemmatales bacterium]MDW8387453.1 hypothetical protein [Gemmatales bacterium]